MAEYLIDTNVFSRIFTGNAEVKRLVESFAAAIDTTVYVECLQGSKSNREKKIVESYLTRFELYPLTPAISVQTINLIRTSSNTHGLLLADALIAATCLTHDLTLFTSNVGYFHFIAGLKRLKPSV